MASTALGGWPGPAASGNDVERGLEAVLRRTRVTFADNMDEPVHRWFRFPAGFSARLVRDVMEALGVGRGRLVLDPFAGSGTTNVVCKSLGIESVGVERHPLLAWVARVKTYWEFDVEYLRGAIERILERARAEVPLRARELLGEVRSRPELLRKVFGEEVLAQLYAIKEVVEEVEDEHVRDFSMLALVSALRDATDVDVGWPYILPRRKRRKGAVPPVEAFARRLLLQYSDLREVLSRLDGGIPRATIYEEDSRELTRFMEPDSVDFAFTSPPYLNNYDYADRTRLELYFLGWASSWSEISEKVRKKLVVSCTHQVRELGLPEGLQPSEDVEEGVREELARKAQELRAIKRRRGGRKDYDIMVVAYFNDMARHVAEMYRVLKDGAYYVMILGDSAPYGVHIPTDEYLARIARHVGFREARVFVLRERGQRWRHLVESGRRHGVQLRESLVLLRK